MDIEAVVVPSDMHVMVIPNDDDVIVVSIHHHISDGRTGKINGAPPEVRVLQNLGNPFPDAACMAKAAVFAAQLSVQRFGVVLEQSEGGFDFHSQCGIDASSNGDFITVADANSPMTLEGRLAPASNVVQALQEHLMHFKH